MWRECHWVYLFIFLIEYKFKKPVLDVTKDPVADEATDTKQYEGECWVEIFVADQIPLQIFNKNDDRKLIIGS